MQRTNIYLSEHQIEELDRLAEEERTSRAELIRRVLDQWLRGSASDIDDDLAAIDASFGALSDVDVAHRGRDARAEHLERIWSIDA